MNITFDPTIKVAGIGIQPWTRVGPELWLPEYKIASYNGWDVAKTAQAPLVYPLAPIGSMSPPGLARKNTQNLINAKDFQKILDDRLPDYAFLTYRPIAVPKELAKRQFLTNPLYFTDAYENKANFRLKFGDSLRIPPFKIYERKDLVDTKSYFALLMNGRSRIVVQDELLSGGKGTFTVSSFETYSNMLAALNAYPSHEKVVVSDYIEGASERSIQGCVTKFGILLGPIQRQIIDHSYHTSDSRTFYRFSGAEIRASDQNSTEHKAITRAAQTIGDKLQAEGYKGIFGVDFLISPDKTIYTLEVNPRLTAFTPLLTSLFGAHEGIPYYLLHILELGEYDYELQDSRAVFDRTGASLIVHATEKHTGEVTNVLKSGTYRFQDDKMLRISDNIRVSNLGENEWLIQAIVTEGALLKTGDRLATLMFKHEVVDNTSDVLYDVTTKIVAAVQTSFKTKVIR